MLVRYKLLRLLIELGINKVTVTITVSKVLVLTKLPDTTLTSPL